MSQNKTPETVADPGNVEDLAREIRAGALSPVDLVQRYLDRIEAVDGQVEAWREVDAKGALAAARTLAQEVRAGKIRGPLHGIPVGVKDIIDVAGLPTRCNSNSRADIAPALADAEVIAALRVAGAIVLGKTHTTEFALRDVSPARNPHNLDHTPGGSSSGSGAAVAAGMVPVALGTQTAASVNRPAAYCGIAAFKPSTRLIPGGGVEPLSYLFDTVGFYGSRVADAAAVFEAICPFHARRVAPAPETLNVAMLSDPLIDGSDDEIMRSLAAVGEKIADAGHSVTQRASPVSFAGLLETHMQTMIYEISRIRRAFLDQPEGAIGPMLLDAIRDGLAISDDAYLKLRRTLDKWRDEFFANFADIDAIVWPATPKTAPKGLEWTGDAGFIAPWTTLGGPVVTMPAGKSSSGMPIGCLLAGLPGSDLAFAATARRLADAAEDRDSVF